MRALIVASGPIADYATLASRIAPADLVLLADGGIRHALALGLTPTHVFGDFDSASDDELATARRLGWPLTRLPREKDKTDTELAVDYALEHGATDLLIIGALGGRLDHSLANLMLLPNLAQKGVRASIIDDRNQAWALIGPGTAKVAGGAAKYLSVVPLSAQIHGVTLRGVKFPLTEATLTLGGTLSVSNEFAAAEASVTIGDGIVLVIRSDD